MQRGIKTLFLEEWFMFGFDHQRRPISGLYREIMGRWALAGIERVYAAGLDQGASQEASYTTESPYRYTRCTKVIEGVVNICRATGTTTEKVWETIR